MSTIALSIVEEFKRLPLSEQRQVCEALLREMAYDHPAASQPARRIADIAGRYQPQSTADAKDHDRGFAEAIQYSKCAAHSL